MRLIRCLLLAALAAAPASADDRPAAEVAAQASADLAAAATALSEADSARDRVAALTETVRAYELGLSALRDGLRRSVIREREIRAEFAAEEDRLGRLVTVLLSMQTSPEALLLLHPSGPLETARAGMLVADVTPALRAEVAVLQGRLEELQTLQTLQDDALETLTEGLEGVQRARTALSQAIADRTDLPQRITADPAAMQALINSADTLDGFAAGLATLAPDEGVPTEPATDLLSEQVPMPVDGVVLRRFNDADAAGVRRPGWVVATRPQALITSPWPATIRFAGPLLDYGNVIILEPESGYLLVLAGLGEVLGGEGTVIGHGAAIALMGGSESGTELAQIVNGGGQERPETLYIEIRRDQVPQDPAEWFLAD